MKGNIKRLDREVQFAGISKKWLIAFSYKLPDCEELHLEIKLEGGTAATHPECGAQMRPGVSLWRRDAVAQVDINF